MKWLLAAVFGGLFVVPAQAQQMQANCGPREAMVEVFTNSDWQMFHLLQGTFGDDKIPSSIWWSEKSGKLAVVVYPRPDAACIIMFGDGWESAPPTPRKKPEEREADESGL